LKDGRQGGSCLRPIGEQVEQRRPASWPGVDRAGGPGRRAVPADGHLRRALFQVASSPTTPHDRSIERSPGDPLTADSSARERVSCRPSPFRADDPVPQRLASNWCEPVGANARVLTRRRGIALHRPSGVVTPGIRECSSLLTRSGLVQPSFGEPSWTFSNGRASCTGPNPCP
jgi:hypothetical protein